MDTNHERIHPNTPKQTRGNVFECARETKRKDKKVFVFCLASPFSGWWWNKQNQKELFVASSSSEVNEWMRLNGKKVKEYWHGNTPSTTPRTRTKLTRMKCFEEKRSNVCACVSVSSSAKYRLVLRRRLRRRLLCTFACLGSGPNWVLS